MPELLQHSVLLETPRMWLRALTPEVYNTLFSGTATEEELAALLGSTWAQEREQHRKGTHTYRTSFVIFQMLDKATDQLLGHCGFHTWYLLHRRAEIGYAMKDIQFMGQGLMREALGAVLRYGFEVMDLNRVEAMVGHKNIASRRLVSGYGFSEEGCMRQHYIKDGDIQDSLVYGLLRQEFSF